MYCIIKKSVEFKFSYVNGTKFQTWVKMSFYDHYCAMKNVIKHEFLHFIYRFD